MEQSGYHGCALGRCCKCGASLGGALARRSSITAAFASPLMDAVGFAYLCFNCAAQVQELIHPALLDDAAYIAAKDQVAAHLKAISDD